MGVYDTDLIMSWTPKEYRLKMQGAQLREVDETQRSIIAAILSGNVARSRDKVSPSKVYNADAMRKKILGVDLSQPKKSFENYEKAIKAVNNFTFKFTPKTKEG